MGKQGGAGGGGSAKSNKASRKGGTGADKSAAEPKKSVEVLKSTEWADAEQRERDLIEQHKNVERQIYEMETRYLSTANPSGNAMKGYEGLTLETADRSKRGAIKHDDRLFSFSSLSGQQPEIVDSGGATGAAAAKTS